MVAECQFAVNAEKRRLNERKFGRWEELPDGGRRYWYDVLGRRGWRACYVKEVDAEEITTKFSQEIFDENGNLVERHVKYPENRGHERVQSGGT